MGNKSYLVLAFGLGMLAMPAVEVGTQVYCRLYLKSALPGFGESR